MAAAAITAAITADMVTTDMRPDEGRAGRNTRLVLRCLPLWTALFTTGVSAAVHFEPQVSAGVVHTDNVTLARENPEAATIYELTPGFSLKQMGPRVTTTAAYQLQGYYYQDRSDSSVYNLFDGNFSAALDPDRFFIDLGASRGQTIRDPRAPIPSSNLPISSNRVNRDQYYAGPRLQYALGTNATVNANYRHTWVSYGDLGTDRSLVRSFEADTIDFSLDNYRKQRGFSWAVRYSSESTDYGLVEPWQYRQASVEIGVWAGQGFRLFTSGGKETPWNMPFDSSLSDTFWEAGFAKQAGRDFSVEVAAGERTFGASKRASLNFVFRHGEMHLSYSDAPTTAGRDSSGSLLLPTPSGDFLTQAGALERYVSKRLEWDISFALRRTKITAGAFDEARKERSRIGGGPLPDEEQRNVNLAATWQAGVRTDFFVGFERSDWQFATNDEQRRDKASVGADYRLGPRTEITGQYERSKQERLGAGGLGYAANLVSLTLTRTF